MNRPPPERTFAQETRAANSARRGLAGWLLIIGLVVGGCDDGAPAPDDAANTADAADVQSATDVPADAPADAPIADRCTAHDQCPSPKEPCRKAVCDPKLGCIVLPMPAGTICDDGDACQLNTRCNDGLCVGGSPKKCKDNVKCQAFSCDSDSGDCVAQLDPDGADCDDDQPCTTGDTCDKGQCQPGTNTCKCQSTADCQDDGNICNGLPYCDLGATVPVCKINPATVVMCADSGDPCQPKQCVPKTGKCALVSAPDATPCDDGDACTANDTCKAGSCTGGLKVCCKKTADCAPLEDGDACNGTLYCELASGTCKLNPATTVSCVTAWDTGCSKTVCDKKTGKCGKQFTSDGAPCDADGSPCTVTDACDNGSCEPGTSICACNTNADCAAKDTADLCAGKHYCDLSGKSPRCVINPATVPQCPSGGDTACLRNQCQPQTGACAYVLMPDSVTCDADGSTCTPVDRCSGGACVADDKVVCPCQLDSDCATYEDGNLCNGTMYCDILSGKCRVNPKTIVTCRSVDDTTCRANLCQPKTGTCEMQQVHQGKACDADGNPCTPVDTCDKGACVADKNVCICQSDAGCTPWQDDNKCNGELYCDKTINRCRPLLKTVVSCSKWQDSECQHTRCVPKTGKCAVTSVRQFGSCDADGNPCTAYDSCDKGTCTAGANICGCGLDKHCGPFQDDNKCNGDLFCNKGLKAFGCSPIPSTVVTCKGGPGCIVPVCDSGTGVCKPGNAPLGKPCDDKNACTTGDSCQSGSCGGAAMVCEDGGVCVINTCTDGICSPKAKVCDDNNPCTADPPCSLPGGCSPTNLKKGTACSDESPCTLNTICDSGFCVQSGPVCNDGDPCTADACDGGKKCVHTTISGGLCDDNFPCTVADTCTKGACAGSLKACDDNNACTTDACAPKSGDCTHTPTVQPCTDGNACTKEDACSLGECEGKTIDCGDNNPCTADTCVAKTGCKHTAGPEGLPCTFGACWFGGKCSAGKCSSDSERLWEVLIDGQDSFAYATLHGVADGGDGTLVVVGTRGGPKGGGGKAWTARLDAHGKPLWHHDLGGYEASGYRRVVVGAKGGYMAAGSYTKGGLTRPLLTKVDLKGQLVWQRTWSKYSRGTWTAVRPTSDGGVLLTGFSKSLPGIPQALWARVSSDNTESWFISATDETTPSAIDLVIHDEGQGAAKKTDIGTTLLGVGGPWMALAQRDGAGKLLWRRRYDETSKFVPRALARDPKGDFVVVGQTASARGTYVMRTDATGRMRWRREFPLGGTLNVPAAASGVTIDSGGNTRVLAHFGTIASGVFTQVIDTSGTLVHESKAVSTAISSSSPVILPGGGIAFVGVRSNYPAKFGARAYVVRTDGWGHATCKAAGVCFGTAQSKCNDGAACTTDSCDATKGCVNTPLLSNEVCEDNKPCTFTAACTKDGCTGGDERLLTHPKTLATSGDEVQWQSAGASTRETIWLAGRRRKAGTSPWFATLERRGRDGKTVKSWTASSGGPTAIRDMALGPGFEPFTVGSLSTGPWLAGHTSQTMGPKWQIKPSKGKSAVLTGVTVRARGSRVLGVGYAKTTAGFAYGWMLCATTKGKQLWSKDVVKNLQHRRLVDAVGDGGGFFVAGWELRQKFSGAYRLWVARVDVNGAVLWGKQLNLTGSPSVRRVAEVLPIRGGDGGMVIGGGGATSTTAGWIARVTRDGVLSWSKKVAFDTKFANSVTGLAAPAGDKVIAAVETGYADTRRWLATYDLSTGTLQSKMPLPNVSGHQYTRDLVELPHGDVAIVGWDKASSSPAKGRVIRMDAWGHTTCTAAKLCAGLPLCTDGDACTTDSCTPDKGCGHTSGACPK
ncbi:MAG: hypothetical protein KC502_13625 [Myxococcales bacterium]|nr:hypothetical protein [Myxococcales bacterium]